ncbi:hypothetical protein V6N11_041106 [Hibiscus sabdariffa]|uniref:Uncharacterized protein n=1 Tax=Hibiscus sabdariffa TaxID=183260 RepID=A0ABR2RJV2_9ROSI
MNRAVSKKNQGLECDSTIWCSPFHKDDLVFEARVLTLSVLSNHHNINTLVPCRQARQIEAIDEGSVQMELSSYLDVKLADTSTHCPLARVHCLHHCTRHQRADPVTGDQGDGLSGCEIRRWKLPEFQDDGHGSSGHRVGS